MAAIRGAADADTLTLFVGAGASLESGIPTWTDLVRRLLSRAGSTQGLRGDDPRQFAEWVVTQESVTSAGAIAQLMLRANFLRALQAELYGGLDTPTPGETARAAARVRLAFSRTRSELVTTNYDDLLEQAVRTQIRLSNPRPREHRVVTTVSARRQADREIAVRHLHGLLLASGRVGGDVVLSDADYHLMQDPRAWQEDYFRGRLQRTTCLFVGTSLTDPNLLRYLWRTGSASRHFALFAREQDADLYAHAPIRVRGVREAAADARWRAMGVRPLRPDFFSESAQFLHEVAARREQGASYIRLDRRLARWQRAAAGSVLSTRAGFRDRQDDLQAILEDIVAVIRTLLTDWGAPPRKGERLQCSLWAYLPDRELLVNWASSDRVWRDASTLEPVPIAWDSEFVSVRAFTSGTVVSLSTAQHAATRWNHVVAAPLYSDTTEYGRLPVGVVTIASSATENSSALHRGMGYLRAEILPAVLPRLVELLEPT